MGLVTSLVFQTVWLYATRRDFLISIFSTISQGSIQGCIYYKQFLTFYQMMLVMVYGHLGANAMYLAVWVQGSDNVYVVRIGIVLKKEYNRQRLALLIYVQQMEVLYSTLSGNIFHGYLIYQYLNFLLTSVIIIESFY